LGFWQTLRLTDGELPGAGSFGGHENYPNLAATRLTFDFQLGILNQSLRGHYGISENFPSLLKVYRAVERFWRKRLSRP